MSLTGLTRWNGIFIRPRQTLNLVLEKNPGQAILLTFIFFVGVFKKVGDTNFGTSGDDDVIDLLVSLILYGGLMQIVSYNLLIWGVNFSSLRFGGKGNFRKTQIAFTWSLFLIFISAFVLTIFGYSLYGSEIFELDISKLYQWDFITVYNGIFWVLYLMLIAWYFILMVISISEVHQLTIGKSILSLACGFLIAIGPLIAIVLIISPQLWYDFL